MEKEKEKERRPSRIELLRRVCSFLCIFPFSDAFHGILREREREREKKGLIGVRAEDGAVWGLSLSFYLFVFVLIFFFTTL